MRHAELLAFQLLNVFDLRTSDQEIGALLLMHEDKFDRKALHNAAKGTRERIGVGHVAVDNRGGAKTRVHLNHLDFQALGFEKSFGLRHMLRRDDVTAARVGEADF